jgi:hypothetical protein
MARWWRLERAHVYQAANAALPHRGDDLSRQVDMRGSKTLAIRQARIMIVENADEVDDRILTAHQLDECLRVVHIGLDHADRRQHGQLLGVVTMAGRYGHPDTRVPKGGWQSNRRQNHSRRSTTRSRVP